MIDELPDVDELVDSQPYGQGRPDEKLQKFIRPNHRITPEAGMAPYGPLKPSIEIPIQEVNVMNQPMPVHMPMPMHMNCIDISNHIQNCPICSRFYKNDNTIHIVIIVILGLICILLLKRVLNV